MMNDWTPSDAQIEAALQRMFAGHVIVGPRDVFLDENREDMRAALIAAHAAAPPVDMAEFEKALDAFIEADNDYGIACDHSERSEVEAYEDAYDAARQALIDLYVKADGR